MAGHAFEYNPFPTVAPTGAPGNDSERIQADSGAFGGKIATGLEKVGQGLERASDEGFGVLNQKSNMDAQTYAAQSHSWLSDRVNEAQSDYTRTTGQAALNGQPDYQKRLEDAYQQSLDQAPNGAARQMIQTQGRHLIDQFKEIGTRHADSQWKVYNQSTAQGAQASAEDRGITFLQSGMYPDFDHSMWTVGQEVHNELDPAGSGQKDPRELAAIEEKSKQAQGAMLFRGVDLFAKQGKYDLAQKLFDKYKDSDRIDSGSRLRIEGALATHRIDREARELYGAARGQATPSGGKFETPTGIPPMAPRLVAQAETGDPSLGPKALGNISRDAGGTKSYGFTGLNSGSGSLHEFVRQYGSQFGLRGQVGSPGFDAQWHAASTEQTKEFRDAQLKYFQEHDVATVRNNLTSVGIPAPVTSDPRVVAYFADRHVQMGNLHLSQAGYAWEKANGDVPTFLGNMTAIDARPENLASNFRTAIATGVYGPAGHATRLRTRLNGALAATDEGDGTAPADNAPQAPEGMVLTNEGGPTPGVNAYVMAPAGAPGAATQVAAASPTQRVMLSQPTTAASMKQSVFQNIRDNPNYSDEAKEKAYQIASRDLTAQDIAEGQATKIRSEQKDTAASAYVTEINAARHGQGDLVAIAGRINSDPRLANDAHTKEWLTGLATKGSREEQEIGYGPGYRDAMQGILTGRLKFADLAGRDDITTAGLKDIHERISLTRGDVDRHSIEMRINSILRGAKRDLSFEQIDGPVKIMDPKGEQIYNYQFEPDFVKRASTLANEAQKTGDYRELDKFLNVENTKKMVKEYRNPQQMAADRMRAGAGLVGDAAGPTGANAPIPIAPEGVNEEAWTAAMQAPPKLVTGQTPTRAQWGQAVETLMANPSPQMVALFQKYHPGVDAMALLEKINPAAATAAKMTGAVEPDAKEAPPVPQAAAAPAPASPQPQAAPVAPKTEAELHPEAPDPRAQRRADRAAEASKVEEQQRKDQEQWEAERKAGAQEADTARDKYQQRLAEAGERRGQRHAAEPQKQAERARLNYIDVLKQRETHLLGAPGDVLTPAIKRELEKTRAELKSLEK